MKITREREASNYYPQQQTLHSNYNQIIIINLSLGALDTIGFSSETLINHIKSLGFTDKLKKHIFPKLIDTIIDKKLIMTIH